jgi:hypothetical protein
LVSFGEETFGSPRIEFKRWPSGKNQTSQSTQPVFLQ